MALGADDAEAARFEHLLLLCCADGICLGTVLRHDGVDVGALLLRICDRCRIFRIHALLRLRIDAVVAHEIQRHELRVAAEQDIRTTASHVRGNRDGTEAACLCDDGSLALVILCVQDLRMDAALLEDAHELLGVLDRDRADKDWLALGMALDDVVCDGIELCLDCAVDEVVVVLADDGLVGRDDLHGQVVDLAELGILGHGGTGHAGELVVEAEVVLERDRGKRLVLFADRDAFLCLDGLVEALRVAPALHDAARELVDDLDLAVKHDVLLVAVEHVLGLESLLEMVHELAGDIGVDVGDAEGMLDLAQAFIGCGNRMLCLVHLVVHVARKATDCTGEVLVGACRLRAGTGDDERRPCLVDEDGVDLVDDCEVMAALHAHLGARDHVVAQVVEAELGVRAVRDICCIGRRLHVEAHAVLDEADIHAEEAVDLAHPLGVALGEVVVDRDDVDALAVKCIEVAGKRRDKRLAFAGLHLCNHAAVQRDAADELDIEVAHAERALRCLADRCEGLGQKVVERFAVRKALTEEHRLMRKLCVIHLVGSVVRLELVDMSGNLPELLELLVRSHGEQPGEEVGHSIP